MPNTNEPALSNKQVDANLMKVSEDQVEKASSIDHDHVSSEHEEQEQRLTFKTIAVILILSATFGLSFWPVPTMAAMQGSLAVKLGDPLAAYWFIPIYTICIAIGFLLAGANSDLLGRRIFLLIGSAGTVIGSTIMASAKTTTQLSAGLGVSGFFSGFCQIAMAAVPELIPNKYRHIGIAGSECFVFFIVVVGPVIGRYAVEQGDNWQYIYWGGMIGQFISGVLTFFYYHPPKHPKGVSWREAFAGMDYVGAFLASAGLTSALMGIVYTSYKASNDLLVMIPMILGFILLALFALWEQFSNTKYKLCPPSIFASHNGREFSVPFVVAFIVTMFYYGINIIYPTMINVFYVNPTTPRSHALLLTLPGNLGLVFGAVLLICFGHMIRHYKWTLVVSFTGMVFWGGLLALVTPYNKGTMIAITFLEQTFFGWAQYESIAFTQLGVHQHDLGVSCGLAGMARFAGGSLATAIYSSILANTQSKRAAVTVPAAAIKAGLSALNAADVLAAISKGAVALEAIPGMTAQVLEAVNTAYLWSYAHGLKITALSSLAFGGLGIIMCLLCEDIDPKMDDKVEIFLENDVHAEKNEFH